MMMNKAEEAYLAWLEYEDWSELAPDTLVEYTGNILSERGTWVVVEELSDMYYSLQKPDTRWEHLNCDRQYLKRIETGEHEC